MLVAVVAWAGTLGAWGCVIALALVLPALSLPFGYAGHVLSRRNGLSRQTDRRLAGRPGQGPVDRAGAGRPAALGVLACAAGRGPTGGRCRPGRRRWWCRLALSVLFPVLLLPLFMKSEPLTDGPLADALWQTVRSSRRART